MRYLAAKGVSPEQFHALLEERSAQECASTEMLVQWLRATMDYDFFIQARHPEGRSEPQSESDGVRLQKALVEAVIAH